MKGDKVNHEKENRTIYLYGDGIGSVQLIQSYGTDLTIVNRARASFGVNKEALDDRDKKLIKYLVDHKHTSTLEHCGATFKFTVPLYIRSQHHRHRTWSYNEISRRYTDVNLQFYEPEAFRTQHKSNRQASNTEELINPEGNWSGIIGGVVHYLPRASHALKLYHKKSLEFYNTLIKAGVCREQARGVLPQNLYTEYYGTVDVNNLLKFITLRLHDGAQWEIQKVAEACFDIAYDLWPITLESYAKSYQNQKLLEIIKNKNK